MNCSKHVIKAPDPFEDPMCFLKSNIFMYKNGNGSTITLRWWAQKGATTTKGSLLRRQLLSLIPYALSNVTSHFLRIFKQKGPKIFFHLWFPNKIWSFIISPFLIDHIFLQWNQLFSVYFQTLHFLKLNMRFLEQNSILLFLFFLTSLKHVFKVQFIKCLICRLRSLRCGVVGWAAAR